MPALALLSDDGATSKESYGIELFINRPLTSNTILCNIKAIELGLSALYKIFISTDLTYKPEAYLLMIALNLSEGNPMEEISLRWLLSAFNEAQFRSLRVLSRRPNRLSGGT